MFKYLVLLLFLIPSLSYAKTFYPKSVVDFHKTSVRIYNLEMSSGGTGSIYKSFDNASHILTNKHVCRLIEPGGYVEQDGKKYEISHYKKFRHHDLCLIRITKNLKIDLQIAPTLAKESQTSVVSGHPNLLPHIATKGHLSGQVYIELVVDVKPCTKKDFAENGMKCIFFGGIPVIEKFDSQVVSNLIKPGSSGSAVFNKYGEIVGVVYAGNGRGFSHGYIVPQIYLFYFLRNAHLYKWTKVGTPVKNKSDKRIFNYQKCFGYFLFKNEKIKKICSRIKDNMIWRKE